MKKAKQSPKTAESHSKIKGKQTPKTDNEQTSFDEVVSRLLKVPPIKSK
jgi:hypothetical protein